MDAIFDRRSIRKYTGEAVSEATLEKLLRAAMAAPSARNQQPWHFVVVRDRAVLERIATDINTAAMARDAQVAVAVCADLELEKSPGYWVQDCAAATQNMLVAVTDAGLGAVWCGIHPREQRVALLRDLLGLPENVMPLSLVVIGHPAEHPAPADRFRPERIHLDRW
jgi:nitroreductase